MRSVLLQLDTARWCLPSSSENIKYAGIEQFILILFFVVIGFLFYRKTILKNTFPKISSKRIDLLQNRYLKQLVHWKYFSFSIRLLSGLLFVFVLITGIYGRKYTSLAAGFTWLFWWTLLIFFVAFFGKIFCMVCPWDFFANLFEFGWLHKTKKKTLSLNLKFPKIFSNIYPAIFFFIILTWLELGFDITRNSYMTAILGFLMVGGAILFALLYEKRAFCRYVCLVGRISGLYAQMSPIELRKIDDTICKNCKTKECITGTDTTTPCPTSEKPFLLTQNTYCTLCTECIRSCDKSNLTLQSRPLGTDLAQIKNSKKDESVLAYTILILTFFHGITMTKLWYVWQAKLITAFDIDHIASFTTMMLLLLIGVYSILKGIGGIVSNFVTEKKAELHLAYVFIPITLGYHLGHNSMHLFVETSYLVPIINDPMGYGWDLFNLSQYKPRPFINPDALRYLQLLVVAIGFYFSVKVLGQRVFQITKKETSKKILYITYYVLLLAFGTLAIWFIYQPMIMKSAGI
ncbi:MAG: 4Fe-4S binding protein [Flavobacteriales bacterium]|nr:4Fe-4S binding protein [Flavobacteriales bacterium]